MKKEKIILISIVLLAIVLRFYALDKIPIGFIPEEISTGWNAYSLLKTGRDEWGNLLPIFFKETGGYKLALNSYLIVPVMAILGPTELAVRIPTAVAGILSVILVYFLTLFLFKKKNIALAASLLLALSPWHISMGRYGVDVNWGIPLFLFGLLTFLKSYRQPKLLILSAISFGLSYYTYFNYDVFTTLFLGALFLLTAKIQFAPSRRKFSLLFIGIVGIFLLPYIISPTLLTRFSQATSVSQVGFVNRINEHRGACDDYYPPVLCRVFYNKVTERGLELSRNYINHFSTSTFFLYGSKLGLSGMPDNWGLFYPLEFLFIVLGIIIIVKKKMYSRELVLWALLAFIPSSLASEAHVWRMLTIVPLPHIVAAIGAVALLHQLRKKSWLVIGVGVLLAVFVSRFWLDYTAYFPFWQAKNSYFGFRSAYAYLLPKAAEYDAVVVAPPGLGFEQLYIYYVFYSQLDPSILQKEIDVDRSVGEGGWVNVSRIGKWYFAADPRNLWETLPEKTLILTDETLKPEELTSSEFLTTARALQTIYNPNGDPAFKIIELSKSPLPKSL